MLYSRTLLWIHPIYNGLHLWTSPSHTAPLPPHPPLQPPVCSPRLWSCFCFIDRFICVIFRFHIKVTPYSTCLCFWLRLVRSSLLLFSHSGVSNPLPPQTVARQAPLSMGFSRQEDWSGLPFPSPGHRPDPGMEPASPALQADSLPLSHWGSLWWYLGQSRFLPASKLLAYLDTGALHKGVFLCKERRSIQLSLPHYCISLDWTGFSATSNL